MRLTRWEIAATGAALGVAIIAIFARRSRIVSLATEAVPRKPEPRQAIAEQMMSVSDKPVTPQSDETSILLAIYQADRAQNTSELNIVFAMLGLALAYVSATFAFADSIFSKPSFHSVHWAIFLVPLPVWLVAAYHSLLGWTAPVRSRSIQAVENILKRRLKDEFTDRQQPFIGAEASEGIMNITEAAWPHKIATVITYFGTLPIVFGYTAYFIWVIPQSHKAQYTATTVYGVLALLIGASWIMGAIVHNKADKELGLKQARKLRHH